MHTRVTVIGISGCIGLEVFAAGVGASAGGSLGGDGCGSRVAISIAIDHPLVGSPYVRDDFFGDDFRKKATYIKRKMMSSNAYMTDMLLAIVVKFMTDFAPPPANSWQ